MSQIYVEKLKMFSEGFINYSYLIVDEETRDTFIVDPSWELDKLVNCIQQSGMIPKGILLTHSHYDHVNLVDGLTDLYHDISVYMSRIEAEFYSFSCSKLMLLEDNTKICIGNQSIECILAPGHTKGSLLYLVGRHLFTGDTIFNEGCGICDGHGGSSAEMYDTVQLVKALPENLWVWPGHAFAAAPGKRLCSMKEDNIYFHIDERDLFISFSDKRTRKNVYAFV